MQIEEYFIITLSYLLLGGNIKNYSYSRPQKNENRSLFETLLLKSSYNNNNNNKTKEQRQTVNDQKRP